MKDENYGNYGENESFGTAGPKIFLSGSIRGGRQLLDTYRLMCDTLEEAGAEVLSWHVADPELEKTEIKMTEEEIYIGIWVCL